MSVPARSLQNETLQEKVYFVKAWRLSIPTNTNAVSRATWPQARLGSVHVVMVIGWCCSRLEHEGVDLCRAVVL